MDDTGQLPGLYGIRKFDEIRLVMVGRTGSGKSATGNTIMEKPDHFESKISGESVTRESKRGECCQAGRKIVVVDTPGLFDTHTPFEQLTKEIIKCVNMSTPGPHAFLLVLQIARFTEEEIETFNRLFDLFGNEIGRFAIITFTKLDELEKDKLSIEAFIKTAPKKLKEFLRLCNGRYIAFDNKASENKKTAKVRKLIQLVDSIIEYNGGQYYTNEMYKEAETALQRKVQQMEEESTLEKKKEIEKVQSIFEQKIKSFEKENKKLAKRLNDTEALQKQFKYEKGKAKQESQRMEEEMKKIDKKCNEDMYQIKKQEKKEKEKQAKAAEEKENQQMELLRTMQQQQLNMDCRYRDTERQMELQLSKVAGDHQIKMEAEIQRIIDGNNEKYNEIMTELEEKKTANEKLLDEIAQKNTLMTEFVIERDKEYLKQKDEHKRIMEEDKERANETFKRQLEEQKKSIEATTNAFLQEQKEKDKIKMEYQQEANEKVNNNLQQQLLHQNATMQNILRERDQELLKQQNEHRKKIDEEKENANATLIRKLDEQKKSIEDTTKELLKEQKEIDERNREIYKQANNSSYNKLQEQLAQQNAAMKDMMRERDKELQKLQDETRIQIQQEKDRTSANEKKQEERERERDKTQKEERQKQIDERQKKEKRKEKKRLEEINDLKEQNKMLMEKMKKKGCSQS